jgi:hypothetical protein
MLNSITFFNHFKLNNFYYIGLKILKSCAHSLVKGYYFGNANSKTKGPMIWEGYGQSFF